MTTASRQRGIALVLVLWLVVLLGIIAGSHAANIHTETLLAARQVEAARARALANAGAELAILQLLRPAASAAWPVDGTIGEFELDGHRIRIAIRDVTGLIDLNGADGAVLQSLFAATGLEQPHVDSLIASILDWRDPDAMRRLGGAEDEQYLADGRPWTARDGDFTSIEELAFVRGMQPEIFRAVAPFITVHSGRANVNLELAPPFVVTALTGRVIDSDTQSQGSERGSGTYQIYVSASTKDATSASLETVVQVADIDDRPYAILDWTEPMRTPFPRTEEDRS